MIFWSVPEETERRVVLADVARVVAELQLLERLRVVRVVEPRKAQRAVSSWFSHFLAVLCIFRWIS